MLTRSIVPPARSRTKTSHRPFESPGMRSLAPLAKQTSWPSALIEPKKHGPLAGMALAPTLALTVTCACATAVSDSAPITCVTHDCVFGVEKSTPWRSRDVGLGGSISSAQEGTRAPRTLYHRSVVPA